MCFKLTVQILFPIGRCNFLTAVTLHAKNIQDVEVKQNPITNQKICRIYDFGKMFKESVCSSQIWKHER